MTVVDTETTTAGRRSWFDGRLGPAGWFLVAYVAVFAVRSITTISGGAEWGVPGDGWRSVWQLLMVAVAITGLLAHRRILIAVGIIGAVYLVATISERFDPTALIGIIPVDERDLWVHPLVAGIAGLAIVLVLAMRAIFAGRPA
jgi:hypothetical protein